MNKKMLKVISGGSLALILTCTSNTLADANSLNIDNSQMSVSELLKEDEEVVEEFDVLYDNNQQEDLNDVNIESRSLIKYHVSNPTRTKYIGGYTGKSVSGEPGMTISLSQMKSQSFSVGTDIPIEPARDAAQKKLGFNFSKSYSISHTGSRTIPHTYNGKKVKSVRIEAYYYYDQYNYNVTWTSIKVRNPQPFGKGSYYTRKPTGYHYKVIYTYK